LLLLLHVSAVHAQEPATQARAAAQALFDEARRLMAEGKSEEACPKLEESQRLDPGVGTQFNLAVCYEAIGRTASAWSIFLEVAAAARSAAERAREQAARARAATLEPKLSRLRIVVPQPARTPGLRIARGSVMVGPGQWDVPLPTDPGTYTITASAPGKKAWTVQVSVPSNGGTSTLTLGPLSDAPKAPVGTHQDSNESWFAALGTQRAVALGIGAGAVIALGIGGAFGVLAIQANDDSKSHCTSTGCDPTGVRQRSDAHDKGNIATVAFIAGGVLAATATTLFLTGEPSAETQPRAALFPIVTADGPGLVAAGRF
jgi:hypothetical protein